MKNSSFRLKEKQLAIKWNPKKKTDILKTMENVSAVREGNRNKKWNDFW